jgi:hypothetical protein
MPTIRSQIDGLVADRARAAVRTAILIDRAEAHGRSTVIVRTRNIEDGRQAVYDALAGRSLLGGCATPEYSITRASVLDERHGLALAPGCSWVPEHPEPTLLVELWSATDGISDDELVSRVGTLVEDATSDQRSSFSRIVILVPDMHGV